MKHRKMGYRIVITQSMTSNLRRIVGEQIGKARSRIKANDAPTVTVHETRKGMKRIRAALKLFRDGLGDKLYRQENQRFRDIAASLSRIRDDDILDDSLLKLSALEELGSLEAISAARALISKRNSSSSSINAQTIAQADSALVEAEAFYRDLSLVTDDRDILRSGLSKYYRQGRKAQAVAYQVQTDDAFHEWRKPVQLHWRHMSLFNTAWPEMFGARMALARYLSQLLGDDHDYSVLMQFVDQAAASSDLSKRNARIIVKLAKHQQEDIRNKAYPLGKILFQQSPGDHSEYIMGIVLAAKQRRPRVKSKRVKDANKEAIDKETTTVTSSS